MRGGPQSSVSLQPSRAGQLLRGAGQLSDLQTVTPALNLIVAGVKATPIAQGVSLEVPPEKADCITVWVGYDPQAGNAVPTAFTPSPIWPASAADQPTRRLFALIKWGAAGGQQYVEIDVSEGCGVVVPSSVCEVYLFSEQTNLITAGTEPEPGVVEQPTWSVSVHAAPGRTAIESRRTRQVVQPLQVPSIFLPPNPAPIRPRDPILEARTFTADTIDPAIQRSWTQLAAAMLQGVRR
jgi:hypothetical protein